MIQNRLSENIPGKEKQLEKKLQERIKELQCLYQIANLSEESGLSTDIFLQKVVKIIPEAWQYPEITCVRIILNDKIFTTENFKETQWGQKAGLYIHEKKTGSIEVYYLEEKPEIDSGPFLKEEISLLNTIGKNISNYLDRKQIEQEKTESEEKYRTIFENTGTATTILEKDGIISLANTKFVELSGYLKNEIENKKTWMEFVVPEDLERMRQQHELRRKNLQEALTEYEFRFVDKNKQIKNIYLSIDMIPGTEKSVASLLDVTEKIKTEKALQQNEERFRKIVEGAPTPIFIQTEMKFSYLNPVACKLFGIKSPDELIGSPVMDRFHPNYYDQIYERIRIINEDRQTISKLFEQKFIRVDGSEVWVETVGEPIHYDGKDGALVFATDITERKEAEKKLKENKTRFRTLFETMAQGVVYQNNKGEITMANKAAEQILGLNFKQMIGKKSVDPEWKAVDKDKNEMSGEKHPAMIALNTGKEVKSFIQGIYNPAKKDYVWIIVNSKPQFKKDATKPYQVFSTFLDITDRKKAEDELRELKINLEKEIQTKTKELTDQVAELERFREATIEREFRIKELRDELEQLKSTKN